jgi:hypothetical protein
MKLKIIDAEYHRNGVCGAGCFVVKFKEFGKRDTTKIAVFYPEDDEKEFTQVLNPEDIHDRYRSYDYFWRLLKDCLAEIEEIAFPHIK